MQILQRGFYIFTYLALAASSWAQLTATVTPGYQFSSGETPTTSSLNALGSPSIQIAGTISGTVGLAAKTVTGVHLADSVPDGITLDFNANSPRQLEIKLLGVDSGQIAASAVTTAKIADAAVTGAKIAAATVDTSHLVFGMPGMVVAWAASAVPTGWLECSGQAVSRPIASGGSVDTYANLYAVIGTTWGTGDGSTTFNVPDLRGEFIRGWDHSKGTDSGRTFASHQTDGFKDHTHSIPATYVHSGSGQGLVGGGSQEESGGVTGTASSPNNGGTETRPRNFALMYVVKY